MIKNLSYFIQAVFIYIFFFIARIVGLKIGRKLFSFIFLNLGPFFKSKNTIENNLKIFSDKISSLRKKEIINNMWKNYGMTFIEYIFLDHLRKSNYHVEIVGLERILFLSNEKPVIFVSGHFANFELMAMELDKHNINVLYNI